MNIPKYVYDKEYSTQWKREVSFLEDKGIAYTYAKRDSKYPVTRYKYTKTPDLFLALAEFYNQVRNEKFHKDVQATTKSIEEQMSGAIEINVKDLTPAERKLMNVSEQDIENVLDDTE